MTEIRKVNYNAKTGDQIKINNDIFEVTDTYPNAVRLDDGSRISYDELRKWDAEFYGGWAK